LKAFAANAGALSGITVKTTLPLQWRFGKSGDYSLLFLINSSEAQRIEIEIPSIFDGRLLNIKNNELLSAENQNGCWHLSMDVSATSYNVLCWKSII